MRRQKKRGIGPTTAKVLQESRAGITWEVIFVVIRRNLWGMASKGQPMTELGGTGDFEPPALR